PQLGTGILCKLDDVREYNTCHCTNCRHFTTKGDRLIPHETNGSNSTNSGNTKGTTNQANSWDQHTHCATQSRQATDAGDQACEWKDDAGDLSCQDAKGGAQHSDCMDSFETQDSS